MSIQVRVDWEGPSTLALLAPGQELAQRERELALLLMDSPMRLDPIGDAPAPGLEAVELTSRPARSP